MITVPYTPDLLVNKYTGKEKVVHVPLINALLIANHKVGKMIPCYLDSGAWVNIFPNEYAFVFGGNPQETGHTSRFTGHWRYH